MRCVGLLLVAAACGSSQQDQAQQTLQLTAQALVDVETSGGETPEISDALEDAHNWLSPVEAAVDIWADGGYAAYERVAPCLASALENLRDALVSADRSVPTSLEQAAAQALAASELGCRRAPDE
ncbi:MAG: hypothetical protein AAGE52_12625 [Myxococcota bacterium]